MLTAVLLGTGIKKVKLGIKAGQPGVSLIGLGEYHVMCLGWNIPVRQHSKREH